jgi:hypothetical protein
LHPKTKIKASRQLNTKVLAKRGPNQVSNTISKSWEGLIINCVVNVGGEVWPRFYIFKGESLWDDFIKLYKLETYMAM